MWICSQLGFYSIVQKDGAHHVRARIRKDLENLVSAAGLGGVTIHESPRADYRWRILVQPPELAAIFGAMANSIDYPNFKSRIHELPDQVDKLRGYGRLWGDLAGLQS